MAISDNAPLGPERAEWKYCFDVVKQREAHERSEPETSKLLTLISRQKVFQHLSYETRLAITKNVFFEKEPKKGVDLISHFNIHKYTGPWRLVLWGGVELKVASGVGKVCHEYLRGDCFGDELTLRALPAGSCYVSKEDGSEFLCLPHDQYETLLQNQEEEEVRARIAFFSSLLVPIFASWTHHQLRELSKKVFPRRCNSRQVIVRENEQGSDLYFIVKGECRVVREIEIVKGTGGRIKKMVKLLELAVLQPGEYFGELAPFKILVDGNAKHRNDAAPSHSQKPQHTDRSYKLLPPIKDGSESDDGATEGAEEHSTIPDIPGTRQATVFSHTPLELLVMPLDCLREHLVGNPLQRMREYAKGYPTATEIRNQYTTQHDWTTFKHNLVNDIINS
eukprot:TRINITY_DN24414_c0_g1_i1.p1 TRINITY_DN24414_c0_g1~~TRINITY_DN24414_c0_g1_i1.p1  ORF type:complete len:393 (+),score=62.94 TRINITY_DN24414_c0_g1_i1:52-1230(+)